MEYLKAVLNNDKNKEVKNLKILIKTGKKLNKNIKKYEIELNKNNNHIKTSKKIEKKPTSTKILKKTKYKSKHLKQIYYKIC